MKAILVDENKNLVWSEVEDPKIKPDEALVKIHAVALNRADLLHCFVMTPCNAFRNLTACILC